MRGWRQIANEQPVSKRSRRDVLGGRTTACGQYHSSLTGRQIVHVPTAWLLTAAVVLAQSGHHHDDATVQPRARPWGWDANLFAGWNHQLRTFENFQSIRIAEAGSWDPMSVNGPAVGCTSNPCFRSSRSPSRRSARLRCFKPRAGLVPRLPARWRPNEMVAHMH